MSSTEPETDFSKNNWPQRLVGIGVLFICGSASVWWTLDSIHDDGTYSLKLASLSPICLVFIVHFLMFPDDPFVLPKPFPVRFWVTNIVALLMVLANIYALQHGLFIWKY